MTETERLAAHAASISYDSLPDDVVDQLKGHVLDTLGVAIGAGPNAESSPTFLDAVESIAGDGDDATAVPTGERLSAGGAALLNGAFAHSLDFDDTHRESSLHPGAPVVPAALAVGEREGATGEEFLAAVSAGYDVACVLGTAVNPDVHYDRGFHITATCGTFGATAAAGAVAGLSREGIESAFGVNGSQAAGSLQFLENGAWNKRLHPGLAARRAVTATALSDAGFRGAAEPIEGGFGFFEAYTEDPIMEAFDGVEERHAVTETGLKPYPCCRYMHPALDGLLAISPRVDPENVESIRVELPKSGVTLTGDPINEKRRPRNFVNCQFSMPYGAALALTAGDAGLEAFLDYQGEVDDPGFRRLMDATDVLTTERVQSLFPDQWAARVVVEAGGETHEEFVDVARGEPEAPMAWEEIEDKFDALARSAGLSADARADVVEAVRDLENRSVDDLVEAIRRGALETVDA